jgi:cytochrome c-type biogenesis protein CcmH
MRRAALPALLLALVLGQAQAADTPFEFKDAATERRYQKLAAELRCLVCQNQSLADSHADLAQDLRDEVYRMMNEGRTDEEIVGFLVERYGDFVLYRPPVSGTTSLLWFGPVLLLLGAGVVWWRIGRARAPAATPDPDEAAAIAALKRSRNEES